VGSPGAPGWTMDGFARSDCFASKADEQGVVDRGKAKRAMPAAKESRAQQNMCISIRQNLAIERQVFQSIFADEEEMRFYISVPSNEE
jgi:hypothetical protein